MPAPLPPPVSALERRLGIPEDSLADEDKARAEDALEDATTLALASVAPTVASTWEVAAPRVVVLVVLKAARREYENPQGFNSETYADHSASLSETSGVFLTDRELALLRAAASGTRGKFVGTIRTPSAYDSPEEVPLWLIQSQ